MRSSAHWQVLSTCWWHVQRSARELRPFWWCIRLANPRTGSRHVRHGPWRATGSWKKAVKPSLSGMVFGGLGLNPQKHLEKWVNRRVRRPRSDGKWWLPFCKHAKEMWKLETPPFRDHFPNGKPWVVHIYVASPQVKTMGCSSLQ